jgi:XTP/dITP diphosphohydrolase
MAKYSKIIFASSNQTKLKEVRYILQECEFPNLEILSLDDIGLKVTCEEDGKTYVENAMIKAFNIYRQLPDEYKGIPILADDSGYEFAQWPGKLGLNTHRQLHDYPVEHLDMSGDLRVSQHSAMTFLYTPYDNNCETQKVNLLNSYQVVYGKAINEQRGNYGSYYMNSFIPIHQNRTFSELGMEYICNNSARAITLSRIVEDKIRDLVES